MESKLVDSAISSQINLEYITLYSYKQYFLLTAIKSTTGISSQIKIDRKTHNITQLDCDKDAPPPSGYLSKTNYSVFLGILPILSKHFLLFAQKCIKTCSIEGKDIYELKQIGIVAFEAQQVLVRDAQGKLTEKSLKINDLNVKINGYLDYLKLYLLSEGYYFSFHYDLSLSRQAFAQGFPQKKKFIWNFHISRHLRKLPDRKWFVGLIQGYIGSFTMTLQNTKIQYILITKRSWTKGGTRFNSRGADSKGNVANFNETEQLVFMGDICFAHVQIRGSVPVFWKQTGIQAKVQFDKSQQDNEQTFSKHFSKLIKCYKKVLCLDLLCKEINGEIDLILYYERLIKDFDFPQIRYEYFDVHCACKGQKFQRCNYLIDKTHNLNQYFKWYSQNVKENKVTSIQNGVVRVNCLDNLDRTNLIQSKVAYDMLTSILQSCGFKLQASIGSPSLLLAADSASTNMLVIALKNIWADNGDMISKHYTGTGSTHTNITRAGKRNILGMIDHSFKSVKRLYQQYVDDNNKQEVIDILLGQHTQTINLSEFDQRLKEIAQNQQDEATSESLGKSLTQSANKERIP